MVDDPRQLIGARLATYRIVSLLGQGATGWVYRARDLTLQRDVALKVLRLDLSGPGRRGDRFLREARAAARLNHPHIVQIYAAGMEGGLAYLALELVRGGSLTQLGVRLGPRIVVEVTRDAALGLAAAHAVGIVHRDVKPDNMLIAGGRVKLTDFGIARVTAEGSQRLTRSGFFLGTPRYASPEQCSGAGVVDGRADLYSLGVVAYELLTGAPPHAADTPLALLTKIVQEPPRPIREVVPAVPEDVAAVVHRLLEKRPEDRPADGEEVARALERCLGALPESPSLADAIAAFPRFDDSEISPVLVFDDEDDSVVTGTSPSRRSDVQVRATGPLHGLAAGDSTSPTLRTPGVSEPLPPKIQALLDRLRMLERLAASGHAVAAVRAVSILSREVAASASTKHLLLSLEATADPRSETAEVSFGDPVLVALTRLVELVRARPPRLRSRATLERALGAIRSLGSAHGDLASRLGEVLDEVARGDTRSPEADRAPDVLGVIQLEELDVGLALPWRWDELPGAYDDAVVPLDPEGRQQVQAAARVLLGLVEPAERERFKAWNGARRVVPVVSLAQLGSIQGRSAGLATLVAMAAAWLGLRPKRGLAATGSIDTASIPSLPPPERVSPDVYERFLDARIERVEAAPSKVQAVLEQRPEVELCLVPRANEADLAADEDLARSLEASGLEVIYVETVREVLSADLFDQPIEPAPLALRADDEALLEALGRPTRLAALQAAATLTLLALAALDAGGLM